MRRSIRWSLRVLPSWDWDDFCFMAAGNRTACRVPVRFDRFARTRASAFRRASLEAVDFKPPANLGEVVASTVIAAGEREHRLIRDDQARIAAMLGHGQALTIDALGHAWPAQNPALFARVLSDHIVNAGRAAA